MTEEQSYQNQTGQVAPTAQNPQAGSVQPYQQQTGEQLQTSTNKILEGQSNVVLVLPNGTSAVAPNGTASTQVHHSSSGQDWSALIWPILILMTTFLIVSILVKAVFGEESSNVEQTEEADGNVFASSTEMQTRRTLDIPKAHTKSNKSSKRKKKKNK